MARLNTSCRLMVVAIAMLQLCATGCGRLRVPAIDPSGDSFFLPHGTYTTVTPPQAPPVLQPAYPKAGRIPRCDQPPAPRPAAAPRLERDSLFRDAHRGGRKGYLILSPGTITAPVGSEVVLLAGFCSPDGYLVTRQPIQWELAPDGVGHLVSSNADRNSLGFVSNDSFINQTDFAKTRTVRHAKKLTRGTQKTSDDITVKKGQSWVSVTSPTPGTSYITVLAPDANNWDQRRKTAKIHWIDAQWILPGPQQARAGQPITLTTTVQTAEGTPLAGWQVQYEVVGTDNVLLQPGGQTTAQVPTDGAGRANIQLQQLNARADSAQVNIRIVRPGRLGEQLVVGDGSTAVHWSAPGLTVRVTGPNSLKAGNVGTYQIEAFNPGNISTRNVNLTATLPPGLELVNSQPAAQIFGNQLKWNIVELAPQAIGRIQVNCRARDVGVQRLSVSATSDDVAPIETAAETNVFQPSLSVSFAQVPPQVEIGRIVEFRLNVTNSGQQPLYNVDVSFDYDAGLSHVEGLPSPIRVSQGQLNAGETKGVTARFIVRQAGRQCLRATAVADDGQSVAAESCTEGVAAAVPGAAPGPVPGQVPGPPGAQPAPPGAGPAIGLSATLDGEAQRRVNETLRLRATVVNRTNQILNDVVISIQVPDTLEPVAATEGNNPPRPGEISWNVAQMAPGETRVVQLDCNCKRQDAQTEARLSVTSKEGVTAQDTHTTVIYPEAARRVDPDQEQGAGAAAEPKAGELKLDITSSGNSTSLGEAVTFIVQLQNDRETTDQRVQLTVTLPEQLRLQKCDGAVELQSTSDDGRTITFKPVAELRPGERLREFRIVTEPTSKGRVEIVARATSQRASEGVQASASITIVD